MSPNPVTAAAAWTLTVTIDVIAVAAAVAVIGVDRFLGSETCGAGTAFCPTPQQAKDRDAWTLGILGLVLLIVLVLALVRGRFLLALAQLVVIVALALLARQVVPVAFAQLRSKLPVVGSSSAPAAASDAPQFPPSRFDLRS